MAQSISDIMQQRYSRRSLFKAMGVGLAASALPLYAKTSFASRAKAGASSLDFTEVVRGLDANHHLAAGYNAQIVMRWGDAVLQDAPVFNPHAQSAAAQAKQFGFNNDFIAYFPMNDSSEHGLLCINHEYTTAQTMFAGDRKSDAINDDEHYTEMAAHGCSVLEMRYEQAQGWQPVYGAFNRRITATTPMRFKGAAAGNARLQTAEDPQGTTVLGMFGNCAGGQTPWRTYLTCEENIDDYFWLGDYDGEQLAHHQSFGIGHKPYHRWDKVEPRFNVAREPNGPNRYGWVVEIDPFSPSSMPIKHTSLGRFKHEGASPVVNADGRVVVYMGDDEHFQHIYKFVSDASFNPAHPKANEQLLDKGTLYAARFNADGTVSWLPLVHGTADLTAANGFHSQADVLIETRRAAKLLGATPMDRPEDVEVNPKTGRIYAALTKNPKRDQADHVNHRSPNPMGYVLEMIAPEGDHTATTSQWDLFLQGGDPNASKSHQKGDYLGEVSANGWLACPDNLAFDPQGRIWITTDGQPGAINSADAVYGADTTGAGRGITKCLFRAPIGAEVTGPCFTPDGKTFFLSIQHPGEHSSFESPTTRWPDFDPAMPPRSAIIAIRKNDGGSIGD